jgi:two-component system phosphate regulon sensor histidine kinase PhoR
LLILTTAFILTSLYYLGEKRLQEINQLKTIINSIRNNRYKSADEIKLSRRLIELEGDIKLMFMRTQNDIANLKKLEQVRTEFLGNVSHELRTPIFAIQGYLETLLNGALKDDQVNMNFLSKANHHTIRLNNLLNDLIDISMIESGQMRMSFRYFGVKDFIENMANEMRPLAENKGLELEIHPIRPKLELFGDKERLRQVVINLLSNAIKYTDQGKIEVIVEEKSKSGKIVVKDTGIGLSEEDMERVFERFYRVDKDRSKAAGGTGLGLAIVKHIIEAHNSHVKVESKPGEGSEFSFVLKK